MAECIREITNFPIKGVMIDFARLTESISYYLELIPQLREWGYNYLFAHVTDDEGCAIKLNNLQLIYTDGALTEEEWINLIEIANSEGITVIPEIECLGHTGYITRHEKYNNLKEPPSAGERFWSISPCKNESISIVTEVIDAIDRVFNAPFIHIGMDEADIGGSELTQKILKTKPKWKIFGEYLEKIHLHVRHLGKRTMIWGDHVHQSSELADFISKDIIICNWLYGRGHSENYYNLTRYFSDKGFDYIGCPAAVWRGTLFAPHKDNIENIRDFQETLNLFPEKNNLGTVVTLWTPYRYLPQIPFSLLYYAGRRLNGNHTDKTWVIDYTKNQFAPKEKSVKRIANAIRAILYNRYYSLIEETLLPYNLATLKKVNQYAYLALASHYNKVALDSLKILEEEAENITKGENTYQQWLITADVIHRIASFAEPYHKIYSNLSPLYSLGYNSLSKKDNLTHNVILNILQDMHELYDLWIKANMKYRHNYIQEKKKGNSVSELFWKVENGDHPEQRLKLTIKFFENIKG